MIVTVENMHILGERVSQLLRNRDMTQGDLASATGLSQSSISQYMNGHRVPGLVSLYKLSTALGVSMQDLIDGPCVPEKEVHKAARLVCKNAFALSEQERMDVIAAMICRRKQVRQVGD